MHLRNIAILLTVGLILTSTCTAQASPQQAVISILKPMADMDLFSGCVVVRRDGKVVAHAEEGWSDRRLKKPLTTASRFYVASVTKSFTAAAVLMLKDKKLLSLDDSISKFIPDFPHGEVTIRQLLTHTSGFAHPVLYPDFYELAKRPYTTAEAVKLFQDRPVAAPPGIKSIYSDYNYVVLARIIELASGKSYRAYLKQNLFGPLKLDSADVDAGQRTDPRSIATGYQPVAMHDYVDARPFRRSIAAGAASGLMTAEDLALWAEELGTASVVSKASSAELLGDGDKDGILHYRNIAGTRALQLSGWDNVGYAAEALYFPDEHVAVAVTTNQNNSGITGAIAREIATALLDGKVEPLRVGKAENLSRYAGTYEFGKDFYVPGERITLIVQRGNLLEKQRNPSRLMGLIPLQDGSFLHRSSWMRVTFTQDGGHVTEMQLGPFKAEKVE